MYIDKEIRLEKTIFLVILYLVFFDIEAIRENSIKKENLYKVSRIRTHTCIDIFKRKNKYVFRIYYHTYISFTIPFFQNVRQ